MQEIVEPTKNASEEISSVSLDTATPSPDKHSETDCKNTQSACSNAEDVDPLNLLHNELKSLPVSLSSDLTVLDLSNHHLETLPAEICQLMKLTSLILCHNKLKELPENIGDLKHLTVFKASHNNLKSIPLSISKVNTLKDLNLSKNEFARVPNALQVGCKSLRHIDLAHNHLECWPHPPASVHTLRSVSIAHNEISVLPMWLLDGRAFLLQSADISANPIRCEEYHNLQTRLGGQPSAHFARLNLENCSLYHTDLDFLNRFQSLTSLKIGNCLANSKHHSNVIRQIDVAALRCSKNLVELSLKNVGLPDLPDGIGSLESLEILDCRDNVMMMLSESICKLHRLRVLLLSRNEILFLPHNFGDLTNLVELQLDCNDMTALPESFQNLKNLRWLDLYENKLTNFPEQLKYLVGSLKGLDSELNYFNVASALEVDVDWLSNPKYGEMLDEMRNHLLSLGDQDLSVQQVRVRGGRERPEVREEDDPPEYSSIEDFNDSSESNRSDLEKRRNHSPVSEEEESWENGDVDSDDNFDPTELPPVSSTANRNALRAGRSTIIEIPVHIFKPYTFCPSDLHVPSIRTIRPCEVTFPPEEGQFDDA